MSTRTVPYATGRRIQLPGWTHPKGFSCLWEDLNPFLLPCWKEREESRWCEVNPHILQKHIENSKDSTLHMPVSISTAFQNCRNHFIHKNKTSWKMWICVVENKTLVVYSQVSQSPMWYILSKIQTSDSWKTEWWTHPGIGWTHPGTLWNLHFLELCRRLLFPSA